MTYFVESQRVMGTLQQQPLLVLEDSIKHSYGKVALIECIIPIGSTFYKNEKDEIVSNGIIINRILRTNAKLPCAWTIIYLFITILLSCFILFKFFIL